MGRHQVPVAAGRHQHPAPETTRRRMLAGRATAAMASQVLNAGGSLILQVIAAKELGLRGYGAYALCLSLLTGATALYTGYVGDGLTVLDRRNATIRRGLVTSAVLILATCFALAFAMVLALGLGGPKLALGVAVMVVCWLVEETGRRLLMARLEFWRLVANDATYLFVTMTVLGVAVTLRSISLFLIVFAMAIGAIAAVALALFQLPRYEVGRLRLGRDGLAEVARFAGWRSMQASLRPLQLLVARVLLQQLVSLSAVGAVEAGRLVVAPIQAVINGAGGFLLSASAETERQARTSARPGNRPLAERATAVLVVLTVAGGLLAALLAHPLGRIMTGHPVSRILVLGWVLYLSMWGASLGFITEAVARKLTRRVFEIRLIDSVLGIATLASALWLGVGAKFTPWLLTSGALITVWLTRRLALQSRPGAPAARLAADSHPSWTPPRPARVGTQPTRSRRTPPIEAPRPRHLAQRPTAVMGAPRHQHR